MSHIVIGDHLFHKDSMFRVFTRISPTITDVKLHSHNFFEIVFVEQGTVIHNLNNVTSIINAGDIFWVYPMDIHGYFRPNNTKLYDCIFYPEDISQDLEKAQSLPILSEMFSSKNRNALQYINIDISRRHYTINLMEGMIEELNNKKVGWQLKLKYYLLELLIEISRNGDYGISNITAVENDNYSKYIYSAINYIQKHYSEAITVKILADNAGISVDYFYRLFKNTMHISPMKYLKNIRLSKAIDQLKNSKKSITDISYEIGFSDPAYFSRIFSQVVGVSPSEYCKLYKSNT